MIAARMLVLFAIVRLGTLSACAVAQPENVSLTVQVRTINNEPVVNVPISAGTQAGGQAGTSDANGTVNLSIPKGAAETEIIVKVAPGMVPGLSNADKRARVQRWREVTDLYSMPRYQVATLSSNQTTCTTTVTLSPAIRVSGTVLDTSGSTVAGQVIHAGPTSGAVIDNQGRFSVGGVPSGQAYEIFVVTNAGIVVPRLVPASAADADIGTITIPNVANADATVDLTLTNSGYPAAMRRESGLGGVTLVKDDGSLLATFPAVGSGTVVSKFGGSTKPQLPPGKYFVSPFVFSADKTQLRLLERVRSHADLSATGIVSVQLTSGTGTHRDVDVGASASATLAE